MDPSTSQPVTSAANSSQGNGLFVSLLIRLMVRRQGLRVHLV